MAYKPMKFLKEMSIEPTLFWLTLASAFFIIVSPFPGFDIAILGLTLLIIGHIFLKEKLLLAFLIIRPTLDMWRDITLFRYEQYTINVNAAFALLFLSWSAFVLFQYRHKLGRTPLLFGFGILSLFMLASAYYSVSPLTSIIESIKFINIAAIFTLSYIGIKEKHFSIKELLIAVVCSAIIPLAFGILQIIGKTGISTFDIRGRIFGTFAHPNVYAFFLLALLFLHVEYSSIQNINFWKDKQRLSQTVYVLLIALLVMTYTRAALVGLLIFLVVIGILHFKKMLLVLLSGVLGFYVIFFPINELLIRKTNYSLQEISLIARITSRNEDADSFEWRRALIRENIPIIRARPLFGYGYGVFPEVWEEQRSEQHLWDDSAEAHNDYLRLAVEIGVIGLALYALLLSRLLYLVAQPMVRHKFKIEYLYLVAWIIAFLAMSFTDNMLHHTPVMWLTWAIWGAMLAVEYKKEYRGPNFVGN